MVPEQAPAILQLILLRLPVLIHFAPVYCVGTAIANNSPSNGGGTPTAYSVSPALPVGLNFDTNTGVISGTPTAATGLATYTVTASNSCGSTTKDLDITVTTAPSSISYSLNPAVYCQNVAIAANNPTVTGGAANILFSKSCTSGRLKPESCNRCDFRNPFCYALAAADYTVTASNSCGSLQLM